MRKRRTLAQLIQIIFAWRPVKAAGAYEYFENEITGARKVRRRFAGYSPINQQWLDGGPWESKLSPPRGGSGVRR